jgi:N-acetylglutamate synthase-like GNAT family acetyltransferase
LTHLVNARDTFQVRRATVDDLPRLKELWLGAQLSPDDLEKTFTEFQVAENSQGEVVAAIALQKSGADGKLHSETFADFALSDTLRPLLWERVQRLARNHLLFRIWTEETAPFWKKDAGFSTPSRDLLNQLPAPFGAAHDGWLALRLRDESADPNLLDAQFAIFRESERVHREKLLQRAELLKMAGTGIAVLLFLFALAVLVWFIRHRR